MTDRFVSEKELDEAKKKRQEEWDKVRKPDDPEEVPEEVDTRSLYDRLKEVRDRKQAEYEEEHRFKNMIRGLDADECEYLSLVNDKKAKEDLEKKKEDKAVLDELSRVQTRMASAENLLSVSSLKPKPTSTQKVEKKSDQAAILKGAIKRKSEAGSEDGQAKRLVTSVVVCNSTNPSAYQIVGSLPGISGYVSTSDSHSESNFDSDSDSSTDLPVLPMLTQTAPTKTGKNKQTPSDCNASEC